MAKVFVDTGGFYAVADASDRHHDAVRQIFEPRAVAGDLATTDHVIVETWLLLRARLGRLAAMRFWDALESDLVQIFGVTSADFARGRRIAAEWPDQAFSLVDCTSFAVIERIGIYDALAVDNDFRIFRYGPARRRLLRVFP